MRKRFDAPSLAYIALSTALICVSAWIAIPSPMPFTLQTLGVFLVLVLLGGALGSVSMFLYVAMGALGIPVFSGFRGGIGMLFGATGGYIVGFFAAALVYWLITALCRESRISRIVGMSAGLIVCYAFGSMWYAFGYSSSIASGIGAAIVQCVLPFVIPDIIKLVSAFALAEMIRRRTRLKFL